MTGHFEDGHDITLIVAANNRSHGAWLSRLEIQNEVTAATTELVFEWITADVTLRLVDQFGADIPGSTLGEGSNGFFSLGANTGDAVTVPITDNSVTLR